MNILERWQATFNHEEPDYVSSFIQAVMSLKIKEIDENIAKDDNMMGTLFIMLRDIAFLQANDIHTRRKMKNQYYFP